MRPEFSADFWRDRRVLITGHTGFKGSWLALCLRRARARLSGYALPPEEQGLYRSAGVGEGMESCFDDIRDAAALADFVAAQQPEVVFHLAAQALVRASYHDPLGTYGTNVMGTANLLEAVRRTPSVQAVVVVTSDKCYNNREWAWGYREVDRLGGRDPYSSSKACAELVTEAYGHSFLAKSTAPTVASARAGNVIGGGDWAPDRLIPDAMRAFFQGRTLDVRHPEATRPWQHVLEPVGGYLKLARSLVQHGRDFAGAWNFGPSFADTLPVGAVLDRVCELWGDPMVGWRHVPHDDFHEAGCLRLDCTKAQTQLDWHPTWPLERGLTATVAWYKACQSRADMRAHTQEQIELFVNEAIPMAIGAQAR